MPDFVSTYVTDLPSIDMIVINFRDACKGDCYTIRRRGCIDTCIYDFLETAKQALIQLCADGRMTTCVQDDIHVKFGLSHSWFIQAGTDLIVTIKDEDRKDDLWVGGENRRLSVGLYGKADLVRAVHEGVLSDMHPSRVRSLMWNFISEGHRETATITLAAPRTLHRAFYPWLHEDPFEYIDRFMESDEGVLILRGEPGTGKTSFIQNLIWRSGKDAMFTYEDKLFHSDEMFVEFMTTGQADLLIMEDADVLILPREGDGNTVMKKFLNIGDGLVRLDKKKLIISANVVQMDKIDEALLRPGRCFDAPLFERLTWSQACIAADAAGIPHPPEARTYSLAELFASTNKGPAASRTAGRRVGFSI